MLCGDDGLGAVVIERLQCDFEIPDSVSVIDGGTLGLNLLPMLQESSAAIFVDTIRNGGAAPGTMVRVDGDDVLPAVRQHLSVHQIGVADLLDAARLTGSYPSELILLGLVPDSLELGIGLSPVLQKKLPRLLSALFEEIAKFGFSLHEAKQTDRARNACLLDVDGLSRQT